MARSLDPRFGGLFGKTQLTQAGGFLGFGDPLPVALLGKAVGGSVAVLFQGFLEQVPLF